MRLTVDERDPFWAYDTQGRLWTCHTVTTPSVRFPHYPIVTTTYWRLTPRRKKAA